jgi:hypothetical protein
MRMSVLLPFLALSVPACMDASIPPIAPRVTPPDRIGVPAADRLLFERVRFNVPMYVVEEWAGPSI